MKTTDWLFVLVLAGAVGSSSTLLPAPTLWWTLSGAAFLTLVWQAWRRQQQRHTIVELGGLRWNRHDFCENWLITGGTGSGKTRSGILQLLHQLFKRLTRFGLLCIDDKGVLFETLLAMTKHYGRDQDMILLQVRPTNAPPDWKPVHRFNLIGDRSIPAATFAAIIVAAAVVLGNRHEQSFFRRAAQIIIALGILVLEALGYDVTLENLHTLLTNLADLQKTIAELRENPATAELARQLQDFLDQPPEQRAGILGTVDNYLRHFTSPEVAEVFSRDSTFSLADLDQGKVICLALPHRLQTERRYIGTFLKQLFHLHVLRRFDLPQAEREKLNLLVMLADEAQHFVTASDEGLSDHSLVDVVRESGAAFIAATQSTTSLIPPLGAEQAKVLTLNLRNRLIFTAADEDDARASADFLGKKKVRKRSSTYANGRRSETWTEDEVYRIPPHELRKLRKHQCVIVHADKGFRKRVLPPLEPNGSVSRWFRRFRWFE
ncbi:MAG TPA: type IV secretion system DNA-binding domain-containing protein [Verrucomicrobiota bacterium]|nr:type IV secretion system DNA-binding domain-containing protein [Verrucomicrobiota bacterium]